MRLADPAFLFRRRRGQPADLVRARGPALFLLAAAAIFQVGVRVAPVACAPHRLHEGLRPRRLRVRVMGETVLRPLAWAGGARVLLSGEAGPGSAPVAGRPPTPEREHVLSG